jgi:hypothetical protein
MTIAGGHDDIKMGTKWIGTDGWVYVNRGGAYDCSNPALKQIIKKREGDKVIEAAKAPKLGTTSSRHASTRRPAITATSLTA